MVAGLGWVNLNYNSPFNDEAIYVVVGKLGLYKNDWGSYNAQSWMGGSQYLYPALTALAYNFGGIVGSRAVNVICGLVAASAVGWVVYQLAEKAQKKTATWLAMSVLGLSSVSLYVSRLATYDMPSYALFFLGLGLGLWALEKKTSAKTYMAAAMCLMGAFLFKYTIVIYLPAVVAWGYWQARKDAETRKFWLIYFLSPLVALGAIYASLNLNATLSYLQTQASRETASLWAVGKEFWKNSGLVWPMAGLGVIGMLNRKYVRKLGMLLMFSGLILALHLATHRLATLDKHTYLAVAFAAMIAGIGTSELISWNKKLIMRGLSVIMLAAVVMGYGVASYGWAQRYNHLWDNASLLMETLAYYERPGDKVLTEAGPQLILASDGINQPSNMTTFDWFSYEGEQGNQAYEKAVKNGYFDLIQLNSDYKLKNQVYTQVHDVVEKNLSEQYDLVFRQDQFYLYKKQV